VARSRYLLFCAVLALASLGVVVARLLLDAAVAVRDGDAAAARGDRPLAIERWGEAARLYVPGSAAVRQAVAHLYAEADAAERRGDLDTAARAIEALRSAALGTRWLATPGGERLAALDRRLAALYAERARASGTPQGEAFFAARLGQRPGPSLVLSLLALGGFVGFLGAGWAFVRRGLDENLRPRGRRALLPAALAVASSLVFALALRAA